MILPRWKQLSAALPWLAFSTPTWATDTALRDFSQSIYGWLGVAIFAVAYGLVVAEEFLHLRKSKPVIVAAGFIWIIVGIAYSQAGDRTGAGELLRENLLDYAEILLFLIPAMTYINTLEERNVFRALRNWLISSGYSLRTIFWLCGILSFFISAVADNLTTALLMTAVVLAVGRDDHKYIVLSCINIVVAANAGGAFSPFGDITTLMVWQKGMVRFHEFFELFLPSLVNWFVPAFLMSLGIQRNKPSVSGETVSVKTGGYVVALLFAATIGVAVFVHQFLNLPPVLGMMTGLGFLKLFGFYLRKMDKKNGSFIREPADIGLDVNAELFNDYFKPRQRPFDIFVSLKRAEWDTLLFFYGVVLCVGGMGALGYLTGLSHFLYGTLGPTWANISVGLVSAVVDNIPVMFAVLSMNPDMGLSQWLLVTLTAGVGGSLLSIGSAAGVGVMGQARGIYTFFAHLKWSWAIGLGYAASITVHLWLNG